MTHSTCTQLQGTQHPLLATETLDSHARAVHRRVSMLLLSARDTGSPKESLPPWVSPAYCVAAELHLRMSEHSKWDRNSFLLMHAVQTGAWSPPQGKSLARQRLWVPGLGSTKSITSQDSTFVCFFKNKDVCRWSDSLILGTCVIHLSRRKPVTLSGNIY